MRPLTARLLGPGLLLRISLFATLVAYAQTVNFEFVYDDFPMIVMNPWLTSWQGLKQIFLHHSWAFMETFVPARHYRPIFLFWLWIVRHLFGPAPGWFHLSAILLHIAAIALAYQLARKLLRDEVAAAITCVLFATHPTKMESVAWIAAATESLVAVFLFGAVLSYIQARDRGKNYRAWMYLSLVCFLLALFTKETAVVLPIILVAYEVLFPRFENSRVRGASIRILPFVLGECAFFVIRSFVLHGAGDQTIPQSPVQMLMVLPLAFWIYMKQLLWPVVLSAFYNPVHVDSFSQVNFIVPVLGVVLLGVGFLYVARHNAVLKFAAAWYFLVLAPVAAGFYWIQLHDRHLYLPSFGAALIASVAIRQLKLSRETRTTQLQVALVSVVALAWTGASAWNTHFYEDEFTTYTRAVQVAPANEEAIDLLAGVQKERCQPEAALRTLENGLRLVPNSRRLNKALADYYLGVGDLNKAEQLYQRLLKGATSNDQRAAAHSALGRIALRQNRVQDAQSHMEAAAAEVPSVVEYENALENLKRIRPATNSEGAGN
jgi:tetratricopeptide (TPR) repeat protein